MSQIRLVRHHLYAVLVWTGMGCFCASSAQDVTLNEDPRLQRILEDMQKRLDVLERSNHELRQELQQWKSENVPAGAVASAPSLPRAVKQDNLIVSGEAGVGFFHSESEGPHPNSEFRIDEARLFVDVLLFDEGYLFNELIMTQREDNKSDMRIGELYVELEELPWLSTESHSVSLRVGRFDLPFGLEYLTRDAIDNPLISHSLADLWGIDEGIEVFGQTGRLAYVAAIQNGGHPSLEDGDADKAVIGRADYQATDSVGLSVSAMRTGDLDVNDDEFSELWFGNGFIRSLGGEETTQTFGAELVEASLCLAEDVTLKSEYSVEQGERTDGSDLTNRNVFSVEMAVGF